LPDFIFLQKSVPSLPKFYLPEAEAELVAKEIENLKRRIYI
jgi:hypothetical protein